MKPEELEKLLVDAARHDNESGFKYYCRAVMWQKATELESGYSNLTELNDAEYLACLQKVPYLEDEAHE